MHIFVGFEENCLTLFVAVSSPRFLPPLFPVSPRFFARFFARFSPLLCPLLCLLLPSSSFPNLPIFSLFRAFSFFLSFPPFSPLYLFFLSSFLTFSDLGRNCFLEPQKHKSTSEFCFVFFRFRVFWVENRKKITWSIYRLIFSTFIASS